MKSLKSQRNNYYKIPLNHYTIPLNHYDITVTHSKTSQVHPDEISDFTQQFQHRCTTTVQNKVRVDAERPRINLRSVSMTGLHCGVLRKI